MQLRTSDSEKQSVLKIVFAFFAVYVIWGSTYLAIKYTVETLPPFTMAGVRFLVSGIMMMAIARFHGEKLPTGAEWKSAGIVGMLMLLCGNGIVMWAEQSIPSGITSVLVSITPFWMVFFDWIRPNGTKPGTASMVGIVVGFVGVAILIMSRKSGTAGEISLLAASSVLFSSFCWAAGSIYSRYGNLPKSAIMATGTQMLAGSVFLLAAGAILGEPRRIDAARVSTHSILALAYLIVFGTIAFVCYLWLLRNVSVAAVATTNYVNPVVALLLGCIIDKEPFTVRDFAASVLVIGAVVVISVFRARPVLQPVSSVKPNHSKIG